MALIACGYRCLQSALERQPNSSSCQRQLESPEVHLQAQRVAPHGVGVFVSEQARELGLVERLTQ